MNGWLSHGNVNFLLISLNVLKKSFYFFKQSKLYDLLVFNMKHSLKSRQASKIRLWLKTCEFLENTFYHRVDKYFYRIKKIGPRHNFHRTEASEQELGPLSNLDLPLQNSHNPTLLHPPHQSFHLRFFSRVDKRQSCGKWRKRKKHHPSKAPVLHVTKSDTCDN